MPNSRAGSSRFGSSALRTAAIVDQNDTTCDLQVTFVNGAVYVYFDVPLRVANHLIARAPSKGSYFYSHIRDNYDWQLIGKKARQKRGR